MLGFLSAADAGPATNGTAIHKANPITCIPLFIVPSFTSPNSRPPDHVESRLERSLDFLNRSVKANRPFCFLTRRESMPLPESGQFISTLSYRLVERDGCFSLAQ